MNLTKTNINSEAIGGILIILAVILALVFQNTILTGFYNEFLRMRAGIFFGEYQIVKPVILWVNDGLMALFFFYIGLEVKKELMIGALSSFRAVALPLIGGIGGVIVPALIFVALNFDDKFAIAGWAIPTVSDTAFAVGILLLLGSRVPSSLKIFLLLLAIIDDICAVVIVALFYTSELSNFALCMAFIMIATMAVLNFLKVNKISFYILAGSFLWVSFLESGIHTTIAGIIASAFIPLKEIHGVSLVKMLIHSLKNIITFVVMPIFAFVNSGIALSGDAFANLAHNVSLGIMFGLVFGKPLGVFTFSYVAIRLRLCQLPSGSNFKQFLGLGFLTGIGASMSLFIDAVAFKDSANFYYADKLAILIAPFASAIIGFKILYSSGRN